MGQEDATLDRGKEDDFFGGEDTLKDKYLTFYLAGEDYGFEIAYVIEIIGILKITKVPDMPSYIKGVINLRGKVIPVMDVRLRFGLEAREYDARTCIIVVNIREKTIGLVVDEVREVIDIPEEQVDESVLTDHESSASFIRGMGKVDNEVKILITVDRLMYEEDLELIDQAV